MTKNKNKTSITKNTTKKVDIKEKAELLKEIDSIFSNAKVNNDIKSNNVGNKKRNIEQDKKKEIIKKQKKNDNGNDDNDNNDNDNDDNDDDDDDDEVVEEEDDDDDDGDDGGMEYFHDDTAHGLIVSNKNTVDGVEGALYKGISPNAPIHRVDRATGLPVYKAKLLKAGEGGGTKFCPFDCNCCF